MATELSFPKLRADLQQALKAWREDGDCAVPLSYLRLFQRVRRDDADTDRQALNRVLLTALEALETKHKVEADLLRQRFLNGAAMRTLAPHNSSARQMESILESSVSMTVTSIS